MNCMQDFDLTVVGCGPSSYGFLKGLEQNGANGRIKIALICPAKYLDQTNETLSFQGSPKFLQAENRRSAAYWETSLGAPLKQDGFSVVGVHGIGGMARIWGGSYGIFPDEILEENGLESKTFQSDYRQCETFLPFSGNRDDTLREAYGMLGESPSVHVSDRIKRLYGSYFSGRMQVGAPRLLVRTDGEGACDDCNQCLAGCPHDSVWYPQERDFSDLKLDITVIDGFLGDMTRESSGQWRLVIDGNAGEKRGCLTKEVALGAGAVQNFLLLGRLCKTPVKANLYDTPAVAFGFLTPKRNSRYDFFGMGNASFILKDPNGKPELFGNLYDGDSLRLSTGEVFSPFWLKEGIMKQAARYVIAGAGFLASRFSDNTIEWNGSEVSIHGSYTSEYHRVVGQIKSDLEHFGKEGAGLLVSFQEATLGADIHYAGGVPEPLLDNTRIQDGVLKDLDGIRVIGGSTFRNLPPMSPTLSYIANSYRIGRMWHREKV